MSRPEGPGLSEPEEVLVDGDSRGGSLRVTISLSIHASCSGVNDGISSSPSAIETGVYGIARTKSMLTANKPMLTAACSYLDSTATDNTWPQY